MFKREKADAPPRTLIGPGVTIHGSVDFAGGMHVEGRILGPVQLVGDSEGTLAMAASGVVEGHVRATHANIDGRVRGDVVVSGRLALGQNAVIDGNVQYGTTIEMAPGARINGKMLSRGAVAAGPPAAQSLESSR